MKSFDFQHEYDEFLDGIIKVGSTTHKRSIKSGFPSLDENVGPLRVGELIVIGGRPAMGKVAFIMSLINTVCFEQGRPTLFISVERNPSNVMSQLLSIRSGFNVRERVQPENQFALVKEKSMANRPFYLECLDSSSYHKVLALIYKKVAQEGVKLIFIDCIQAVDIRFKKSFYKGEISRSDHEYLKGNIRIMKELCLDLGVTLIIGSELSGQVEKRKDSIPKLNDLKWPRGLKEHADKVFLLHRPEYYGITEDEYGREYQNTANVIVAKNRYGRLGFVSLKFDVLTTRFSDSKSYPI